jgi:hypothetical protein
MTVSPPVLIAPNPLNDDASSSELEESSNAKGSDNSVLVGIIAGAFVAVVAVVVLGLVIQRRRQSHGRKFRPNGGLDTFNKFRDLKQNAATIADLESGQHEPNANRVTLIEPVPTPPKLASSSNDAWSAYLAELNGRPSNTSSFDGRRQTCETSTTSFGGMYSKSPVRTSYGSFRSNLHSHAKT